MEQQKLVIDKANIHTSVLASTRSLTYDECTKACMYEKLKRHSNPSSGLDGTAQNGDWLSKHTHICSCKHTLAHVWRVHESMHVWEIEKPQIHHQGQIEQHKLVIDTSKIHTSARASTRSLTYDECTNACMYEKLKTHTNPSSGLNGTTQTCYWYSKHTHICSCKHIHTSARASTRSLMYEECRLRRYACMRNWKTQIHHQG